MKLYLWKEVSRAYQDQRLQENIVSSSVTITQYR